MRIFLDTKEVCALAARYLSFTPNEDFVQDIAEKMDMKYNEEMDLYEDVELLYTMCLHENLKQRALILEEQIKSLQDHIKESREDIKKTLHA